MFRQGRAPAIVAFLLHPRGDPPSFVRSRWEQSRRPSAALLDRVEATQVEGQGGESFITVDRGCSRMIGAGSPSRVSDVLQDVETWSSWPNSQRFDGPGETLMLRWRAGGHRVMVVRFCTPVSSWSLACREAV